MATVAITINGRTHELACDDGQEEHVRALAAYVDDRARQLVGAVGQVGDTLLLTMLCLLLADELNEARGAAAGQGAGEGAGAAPELDAAALARGLDALSERIEAIADRLEKA